MSKFFTMKRLFFALSLIVFLFSLSGFAQSPKSTPKKKTTSAKPKASPKQIKVVVDEKEEFNQAIAIAGASERIKALQQFIEKFPDSPELIRAKTLIVSGRAELGEQKLQAGEIEEGIQFFKDAVNETPTPIAENFYAKVILQFPTNLFYRGQQVAALQVAQLIENKVRDNPKQLLGLAAFYLGIERANEGRMLAESAITTDPQMPEAYQTLGLAQRLNFELEESEKAYIKALELAPDSTISKRSLAEIKRAVGKPDEAVKLYREIVEKDANDAQANTGLILSLFEAGNRVDAEELLGKSLEANPNNLFLLVGAAYWYAGQKNGARAVELGQKAVEIEPRYTWGRIALARGFMLQNLPFEAEKVLLVARQYGSFPTLDYELASARFQAGLFEEAARELKNRFAVKDGFVQTYIAGRTAVEADNFIELLDLERKASIFTPNSADTKENAEKLESLLNLSQKLSDEKATEEELNQAADEFVKGNDRMKTYRQLYAASRLLDAKKSLPKVLELTQGAVKGVDQSLEVTNAAAAVLSDELLESRTLAISRDEVVIVPEIPTQTLSRIIRGRIEELTGATFYEQNKPQEAVVRLKRAVSILPEKSAWWRSSYWKLGLAYEAAGNSKDALDALVKSYSSGEQDRFRRSTVEGIYRKVNGNLDGLDKLIGESP
ncbi:MAG: tetratricopeptide repeat protein, partial [Blastocatellia bacterium]|nr:tetratricopeptide repeat protein [Blastocatellia bacterium]